MDDPTSGLPMLSKAGVGGRGGKDAKGRKTMLGWKRQ